jgi:hypothetical protein
MWIGRRTVEQYSKSNAPCVDPKVIGPDELFTGLEFFLLRFLPSTLRSRIIVMVFCVGLFCFEAGKSTEE